MLNNLNYINSIHHHINIKNHGRFLAVATVAVSSALLTSLALTHHNSDSTTLNAQDNKFIESENGINLDLEIIEEKTYVGQSESKAIKYVMHSYFKNKLDAFTQVLNIAEGKSKKFVLDNKGISTAYGWNPTRNSKALNLVIASSMGMSSSEKKVIEDISNTNKVQYVPKPLAHLVFSDNQLKQSANAMMKIYEQEFLNVLKLKAQEKNENYQNLEKYYYKLPVNQQAVLIHMTYKLGSENLQKYQNFFNNLMPYMKHPSEKGLNLVASDFEYNYKTRQGFYKHDIKAELTHNVFFSDCSDSDKKNIIASRIKNCKNFLREYTPTLQVANTPLIIHKSLNDTINKVANHKNFIAIGSKINEKKSLDIHTHNHETKNNIKFKSFQGKNSLRIEVKGVDLKKKIKHQI